jgi:hypothetical protein
MESVRPLNVIDEEPAESTPGDAAASSVSMPVRKASGPRTSAGKARSKHNALKRGIFAKFILVRGESGLEFDALLSGIRNDLRPQGTLEEVFVEK